MGKWNNLKEYFGSKFNNITFLDVILYVDMPLIVTFISDGKYYIGYLYEFDNSTLNAHWLISEATNKKILALIDGDISVTEIMIKNKQKCYLLSVEDGIPNLKGTGNLNFKISSDFYITKNTPNEINLLNVRNSLTNIESTKK